MMFAFIHIVLVELVIFSPVGLGKEQSYGYNFTETVSPKLSISTEDIRRAMKEAEIQVNWTNKYHKQTVNHPKFLRQAEASHGSSFSYAMVGKVTQASETTENIDRIGQLAETATDIVVQRYKNSGYKKEEILKKLRRTGFATTEFKSESQIPCYLVYKVHCDPNYPFRSISGYCNNLQSPELGSAYSPFRRLITENAYEDGLRAPRQKSSNQSFELKSPREISNLVHQNVSLAPDLLHTQLLWVWGQYIDHDITLTPDRGMCESCGSQQNNIACLPIRIPQNDPYFNYGSRPCMSFVRSARGNIELGDIRNSEHMALASMHTIWMKQHNQYAKELKKLNPTWDGNRIFLETRRIIEALHQRITYNEFLPALIGTKIMGEMGLTEESRENYFQGTIHKLVKSENEETQRPNDGVAGLLLGASEQHNQPSDRHIDGILQNALFQTGKARTGFDLASLNIQRGRDHGIGYPQDIDLWTGIVSEKHEVIGNNPDPESGVLGPLGSRIIATQFRHLKYCDRFFYSSSQNPGKLSPDQLREIRKMHLSDIICSQLMPHVKVRDLVMEKETYLNPAKECKEHNSLDITKWINPAPILENLDKDGTSINPPRCIPQRHYQSITWHLSQRTPSMRPEV